MKKPKVQKYVPEVCQCCGQSTTYILAIDQGTVDIMKSMSNAIYKKRLNSIHPRKEMEINVDNSKNMGYYRMIKYGYLTSNQVGNLSRARFHGLIAKIKGHAGNYCITRKGFKFLAGEPICKFAIISKSEGHQIGYWTPTNSSKDEVTIRSFGYSGDYWEAIGYEIKEGEVINVEQEQSRLTI